MRNFLDTDSETGKRVFKALFGEKEEKKLNRPLTTEERINQALWGKKEKYL